MTVADTGSNNAANSVLSGPERRNAAIAPFRFKPGQSGNPKGRPKKIEKATDTAVDNLQKAIERAASLVDNEDPRIALAAAQLIIDRAMGKPKQSIETKDVTDARDIDDRELLDIARSRSAGAIEAAKGENVSN